MKVYQFLLTITIFFLTWILTQTTILAQESPFSLRISPSFHDITLSQNVSRQEIEVQIENTSKQDLTFELSSMDVTQDNTTGKTILLPSSKNNSYLLAPYISFPENNIIIKAGEKKKIKAIIENSPSLSVGGHYGAIVAQAKVNNEKTKSNAIVASISSLIFLNKEGNVKASLVIQDIPELNKKIRFTHPNKITLSMVNKGTIHLIPYGRFEIKDSLGRIVAKAVINEDSAIILPTIQRNISARITNISLSLPFSYYTFVVLGRDSLALTNYSYYGSYFYINPYFAVLLISTIGIGILQRKKIYHFVHRIAKTLHQNIIIKPKSKHN